MARDPYSHRDSPAGGAGNLTARGHWNVLLQHDRIGKLLLGDAARTLRLHGRAGLVSAEGCLQVAFGGEGSITGLPGNSLSPLLVW